MWDLLDRLMPWLEAADVEFAEVRLVEQQAEHLVMRTGRLLQAQTEHSYGISFRVLRDGGWGFAGTDRLDPDHLADAWRRARDLAAASAALRRARIRLAPETPHRDTWHAPIAVDPFTIPLEDKLGVLETADREMRAVRGVVSTTSEMHFVRIRQWYANTEGSRIHQTRFLTGAGLVAVAADGRDIQWRSYPLSQGGQWDGRGYEAIREYGLEARARAIAEEAVALLRAPEAPVGEFDVVIGGAQLALQVHESCGHPTEVDRVLGWEVNLAGRTFLTPDQLGRLVYGSPAVHIVADARPEHGLGCGTFAYDDEGVPARRIDLVREGVFVGYMTSRDTALELGLPHSGGCARAEHGYHWPLIRMTNVSLLPGSGSLEDLLAQVNDGLYLEMNKSWSIDDARLNFQFGTEIGWRIRRGRRVEMVRNPVYFGRTPEFWQRCVQVAGAQEWRLWGVPNCGKGQPMQTMAVGHGTAPALFRNISVGRM